MAKKKKQQGALSTGPAALPVTYHLAFWGLALLFIFPPFFRGLFFATEQQKALFWALLVLAAAWHYRFRQGQVRPLGHVMDWLVLAFPLVYVLSAFRAVNSGLAVDEIVKTLLYFIVYFLVVTLVRGALDVRRLLQIIYLTGVGVALAGLATATGIIHIKDGFLEGRIYGTFQYGNALASYLIVITLTGFYLWQSSHGRDMAQLLRLSSRSSLPAWLAGLNPYYFFYALTNMLVLVTLFGTRSNGGIMVFAVILLLYFWGVPAAYRVAALYHVAGLLPVALLAGLKFTALALANQFDRAWLWVFAALLFALLWQVLYNYGLKLGLWEKLSRRQVYLLAVGAGLVLLAVGVFAWQFQANQQFHDKVITLLKVRNVLERFAFHEAAQEMFQQRPLLGWGGGGWQECYRTFQNYGYISTQVHGHFFQVAVEAGALGAGVFLAIWVVFFWLAHRCYYGTSDAGRRLLVWTLALAVLGVGLHAWLDFDLSLSAHAIVLWALWGMLRALAVPAKAQGATGQGKPEGPAGLRPLLWYGGLALIVVLLLGTGCLITAEKAARQATSAARTGQGAVALQQMQKAAAYNPFRAEFHINLSKLYLQKGDQQAALAEGQRALQCSQYASLPRANLANVYFEMGDYEQAVSYARQAVQQASLQNQWYELWGRTCFAAGTNLLIKGQREKSAAYLQQAAAVPAMIKQRLARVTEEEMKLWVQEKLQETPAVQLSAGAARCLLGEYAPAEAMLRPLLQNQELKGEAALWLAVAAQKQGRVPEAQQLLQQAQSAVPELAKGFQFFVTAVPVK
ncbi:MAG: tetratricopeptide repeat protein [Desulfurispora sp.]|uniref:tetratricopeptide repeat protein n=1 Tax=Desulfurispora sp. TaxID=3014275 RepID=UPI00404A7CF4